MSEQTLSRPRRTARDLLTVVFRHSRLIGATFLVLSIVAGLGAYLQPVRYEATAKLLVTRHRIDAAVTPALQSAAMIRSEVSEEDLRSEAQILKSRDLLRKVVTACRLTESSMFHFPAGLARLSPTDQAVDARLDRVVERLGKDVDVEVVRKSNLLGVTYRGTNPQQTQCVLSTLTHAYIDKHVSLQRPTGTLAFFERAAADYRNTLESAEQRLRGFVHDVGTGSVDLTMDLKIRRLGEAEALLRETEAGIAETTERVRVLQTAGGEMPSRHTTQVRTVVNPQLMERLESTLLDLELKRTELASRYQSDHLPLQDVERQIQQTHAAIDAMIETPLIEETTDRDPTHEWMRGELAKATAELAALHARATSAHEMADRYHAEIRALGDRALEQQGLLRQVKTEEENYLLYLRKQEEARIAEALDAQHITNVVLAEAPEVPSIPTSMRAPVLMAGLFLAALAAILLAFVVDGLDPSFRTPEEVRQQLGIPVLAAIPKRSDRSESVARAMAIG